MVANRPGRSDKAEHGYQRARIDACFKRFGGEQLCQRVEVSLIDVHIHLALVRLAHRPSGVRKRKTPDRPRSQSLIEFSPGICWQHDAQRSGFEGAQLVGVGILNLTLLKMI